MPYTLFVTSPPTQGKRVRSRTKNKGHLFITNLPNIPYKKKTYSVVESAVQMSLSS